MFAADDPSTLFYLRTPSSATLAHLDASIAKATNASQGLPSGLSSDAALDSCGTDGLSSTDDALVMNRFAQGLCADGWALVYQSEEGAIRCLATAGLSTDFGETLLRIIDRIDIALTDRRSTPVWLGGSMSSAFPEVLLLPVERVDGHAAIFVILLFGNITESSRTVTEERCAADWPTISAYFRQWQLRRVERRAMEGAKAGLNVITPGMILLSGYGQIIFANEAAHALLNRRDGICERRGQVHATDRGDAAALSAAIGCVLAHSGFDTPMKPMPLLTLRREHGPPLVTALVCSPHSLDASEGGGALLCLVDPELDIHGLAEPVCKLYRLSRVESELTCRLASGQDLASAANSLHIKMSTARSYLKQVFAKTGSNRQSDLARLILLTSFVRQ